MYQLDHQPARRRRLAFWPELRKSSSFMSGRCLSGRTSVRLEHRHRSNFVLKYLVSVEQTR